MTLLNLTDIMDLIQSDLIKANAQLKAFEVELQMNPQQALTASNLRQSSNLQKNLKEYRTHLISIPVASE
jgi:polysaccharide biosynthesis transport protein